MLARTGYRVLLIDRAELPSDTIVVHRHTCGAGRLSLK
jgi:hypothetical protein